MAGTKIIELLKHGCLLLCVMSIPIANSAHGAEAEVVRPKIGSKIDDFEFKDRLFLRRRLSEFENAKAIVVVASNTSCPIVQKYWPKLVRMHKDFQDQGVQFIGLNVLDSDSVLDISAQAVKYEIPFPLVKSIENPTTKLGLTRTPEVVVLDHEYRIRYRGRIDDQHRLGASTPRVKHDNLREALTQVLAGKQVAVASTAVDGCLIGTPPDVETNASLTWAKDIQPLIKTHCAVCHQAGTEAPFALQSYDDVVAQAAMIDEVVDEGRMPPWHADKQFGTFINQRRLKSVEKRTIRAWIKSGLKRGAKTANTVVGPTVTKEISWQVGTPDKIIRTLENHELPADGYIPYRYSVLPYVFSQDTWLEAIEILPDNPRVVHHANLVAYPLGGGIRDAWFITGKVPGAQPLTLKDGVAVHIPKGTILALQIHFTTTGQPEQCRLAVGLHYAGGKIRKSFRHVLVKNTRFKIPPGDPFYRVEKSQTLPHNTTGIGLFTHMHVRGRDMTFIAHYPDGRKETLLSVPSYNFDWQVGYRWKPETQKLPKGTRIQCVAHFDNSEFNPFNPDPTATVVEGQQTYHEMMYGFYFYTKDDENLDIEVDPKTGLVKK